MKKIINSMHTFATLMAIISISVTIESTHNNMTELAKKKQSSKIIAFIPDVAFGSQAAQGEYKPKQQSATITHGDTIYSFTHVTSRPTNPSVQDKKNQPDDIVGIGLFSNSTNRAGMPVITYLFASHANITTAHKHQPNNDQQVALMLPQISDTNTSNASITFKPGPVFAHEKLVGNYTSSIGIANLADSSGAIRYSFHNVIQHNGISAPEGLTLLGSYISRPKCNGGTCAMSVRLIKLYGKLSTEQNITALPDINKEMSDDQGPQRKPVGSDQATWAPIIFDPSVKFNGQGLKGNYFASNKIATIHDASQNNPVSYTFHDVEKQDTTMCSDERELIGSYEEISQCDGGFCPVTMKSVNLCGKQIQNQDL